MWHFKLTVRVNSWQNAAHVAKAGSKEITKVLCTRSRNLELFCKHEALVNSTTNQPLMSHWDTLVVYMKVLIVCILTVLIVSRPYISWQICMGKKTDALWMKGWEKYYDSIRHLIQTVWKIQWCVCDVDHTNRDVGKWRKTSGIC